MRSPIENRNILISSHQELSSDQKKMFKYFGEGAKIKSPFRILNPQRIMVGDRTSIQENCHINAFADLTFLLDYMDKQYRDYFNAAQYIYDSEIDIGRECQIGRFFFVSCTNSITIKKNVLISERVFIGDNNHTSVHKLVPIMQQPNQKGLPILISEGCWVGVGASILKGTVLGINTVVSANSVVQGVFPSHSVIGHEKARLLYRKEPE